MQILERTLEKTSVLGFLLEMRKMYSDRKYLYNLHYKKKTISYFKNEHFFPPKMPLTFLLKSIEIHSKEENSVIVCACSVASGYIPRVVFS